MTYEWLLAFSILGVVVGFVAGLLGVGGGGIMVPALTVMLLAQGIDTESVVHLALGTSMACIVFTSIASLRAHRKAGAIVWPVVSKMSGGVILGTFLATFLAAQLNSLYLAMFFSAFMGFTAWQMFFKKTANAEETEISTLQLLSVGTGIGAISALVSIGGGSLTVPYLTRKGIDIKKAIGTSAAMGLPISVAGTLGYLVNGWSKSYGEHLTLGFVFLPAVACIAVTSFFTAPIGAKVAHALPVAVLKKVFALLLVALSIKMLTSVW
ncbi:sulfite exporter TauE/SafE family protein [Thalassotalea euphylliae]|uniref:sulfite exporter TauE/SafE family protein n=1 Tax=Thalassotalea euphylliae TaxID=1655234 RepID=UPI00363589A9